MPKRHRRRQAKTGLTRIAPPNHMVHAVDGQENPQHEGARVGIGCAPLLLGDKTPEEQTGASEKGQKTTPKWVLWFSRRSERILGTLKVVGIVAGIGYAVVTYCMWRDAQKNFRMDQRALVSVSTLRIRPNPPVVGQPVSIEVVLRNFGRTPAKYVSLHGLVEPIERGKFPNLDNTPSEHAYLGTMMPTMQDRESPYSLPEVITWDPAVNKAIPATPNEIEFLMSGKTAIYAHGIVRYSDIFLKQHWTKFCLCIQQVDQFGLVSNYCDKGNDTDSEN